MSTEFITLLISLGAGLVFITSRVIKAHLKTKPKGGPTEWPPPGV